MITLLTKPYTQLIPIIDLIFVFLCNAFGRIYLLSCLYFGMLMVVEGGEPMWRRVIITFDLLIILKIMMNQRNISFQGLMGELLQMK